MPSKSSKIEQQEKVAARNKKRYEEEEEQAEEEEEEEEFNPYDAFRNSDSEDSESSGDEEASKTTELRKQERQVEKEEEEDAIEEEGEEEEEEEEEEEFEEEETEHYERVASFDALEGRKTRNGVAITGSLVSGILHHLGSKATAPTEIQSLVWGALLCPASFQRDIVAISKTGSGKTLAFLVPLLAELSSPSISDVSDEQLVYPQGLIIAPTRELALQSFSVAQAMLQLCPELNFRAMPTFGGQSFVKQTEELMSVRPRLIAATPGRLVSLCGASAVDEKAYMSLSDVRVVVVDEADRMFDIGFGEDLMTIAKLVHKSKQDVKLILTSATWQQELAERLKEFFVPRPGGEKPLFLFVGTEGKTLSRSVTHVIEMIPHKGAPRFRRLVALLTEIFAGNSQAMVIVFTMHKGEAKEVAQELQDQAFSAVALQGDMSQTARQEAIKVFRSGESRVLVATDVAARGLDVPGVTNVINYSIGLSIENYIHRCGRTGRAGRFGTAHTFVTKGDEKLTPELVDLLQEARQKVPDDLRIMASKERKRRERHAGSATSAVSQQASATAIAGKQEKQETEEEILRRENRERQLQMHKKKLSKQHAGMKKKAGRRR